MRQMPFFRSSSTFRPVLRQSALSRPRFFSSNPRYIRFSTPPPNQNNGRLSHSPVLKIGVFAGLLGGVFYVTHLEKVQETSRWRFMAISAQNEQKLAKKIQAEVLREYQGRILDENHPLSRHVKKVVGRIVGMCDLGVVAGEADFLSPFGGASFGWDDGETENAMLAKGKREWKVITINDPKLVNAFAVPGLVAVSTGILPICQDEQGLAAVLGHEIAHVVLRHSSEKLSSAYFLLAVYVAFAFVGIDLGFLGDFASQVFWELPNSRNIEKEADIVGLRLLAESCYDPAAAPAVFERMHQFEQRVSKRSQSQLGSLFNTHPLSSDRTKYLTAKLPQAYEALNAKPECARMSEQIRAFEDASRMGRVLNGGPVRPVDVNVEGQMW